ncbi:hypothetical protein TCAL_17152 [Tigriopus californicus]|uniref:Uncharacterized protein n=1 Tax=Tigriopus californicus TaxID=6832 RepID=A0A553P4G4_TIGCA|nr:hypothetical protein TCAL_17152 [Tigriopus californicus]
MDKTMATNPFIHHIMKRNHAFRANDVNSEREEDKKITRRFGIPRVTPSIPRELVPTEAITTTHQIPTGSECPFSCEEI